MHLSHRAGLVAAPMSVLMAIALTTAAGAQVATLEAAGTTPEPEAAAETTQEFADRDEALLAFAQCMRDNGIDMDDPEPGTRGGGFFRGGPGGGNDSFDIESETFQLAQQACASILEAARPDLDPEAEAERLEENLAMAQCFRDSGFVDYPDPVIGSDGRLQRFGGRQLQEIGIDFRSDAFQDVRESCATELGVLFGPGGRGGPGGGD